jgi:hypothetical protein
LGFIVVLFMVFRPNRLHLSSAANRPTGTRPGQGLH